MLTQNLAKLVIILLEELCQKWGLDFIELVKPTNKLLSNQYIWWPLIMQGSGWKHKHSALTLL
jgi:hypothetical protein